MSGIADVLGSLPVMYSTWDGGVAGTAVPLGSFTWDGTGTGPSPSTEVQWDGQIIYRPAPPDGRVLTFRPQSVTTPPSDPPRPDVRTARRVITGLLAPSQYDLMTIPDLVSGVVVEIPWRDLQPVEGGPVDDGPLRYWLGYARTQNLAVRLRILAGTKAPTWAKLLGGFDPILWTRDEFVGPFWRADYVDAYNDFILKLSVLNRFAEPFYSPDTVREIVVSTTMTDPLLQTTARHFPEGTADDLLAAGYTRDLDVQATLTSAEAHWNRFGDLGIRSVLEVGPTERLDATAVVTSDWETPTTFTQWWSAKGALAVTSGGLVRFGTEVVPSPGTYAGVADDTVSTADERELWFQVSTGRPTFTPVNLAHMVTGDGAGSPWASPYETGLICGLSYRAFSFVLPRGIGDAEGDMVLDATEAAQLDTLLKANAST